MVNTKYKPLCPFASLNFIFWKFIYLQ